MTNKPLRKTLSDRYYNLRQRCDNPNNVRYVDYGGRGIECKFKSFQELYDHITLDLGYDSVEKIGNLQIDRIDNNEGYEIGNIRLTTSKINNNNKRNTNNVENRRFLIEVLNTSIENKNTLPKTILHKYKDYPKKIILISLFRELQRLAGDQPFYLVQSIIAEAFNVRSSTVSIMLWSLGSDQGCDGIIQRFGKKNEYRYIGSYNER